jgi:hypothetical protein
MEKADFRHRDGSTAETLTLEENHKAEYANGTALTARQKLNPQPTDDPNDPVSKSASARRMLC